MKQWLYDRLKDLKDRFFAIGHIRVLYEMLKVQAQAQQEIYVLQLLQAPRYREPLRLAQHESQVFSQHGADGIIGEIFRRIGITSRQFVEIGCADGVENNTTYLLWQGWSGFWFDGSEENIAKARQNIRSPIQEGRLKVNHAFFTAENAAGVLERAGVPKEFDLLSLDIDRNTYYIWEGLAAFRPRVVIIEYNSKVPPGHDWKVKYDSAKTWNYSNCYGASLKALEKLGESFGYSLVGCDIVGVDAFFVRNDCDLSRFAQPFTAENHYEPPRFFLARHQGHRDCFED